MKKPSKTEDSRRPDSSDYFYQGATILAALLLILSAAA